MRKVCLKNGKHVFCGILLQCKPNPAQRFFLSHKRMCLGTFSRRGAVALATIYPCAECASSRSIFIVWKRSFLYDKNPEEKSSGSVRCLLWVSSASAKTHQKKQSSSSIQTVLSASEFPSAPIAEGSPNHAPLTYTAKGSWAIPPVGTCTRP